MVMQVEEDLVHQCTRGSGPNLEAELQAQVLENTSRGTAGDRGCGMPCTDRSRLKAGALSVLKAEAFLQVQPIQGMPGRFPRKCLRCLGCAQNYQLSCTCAEGACNAQICEHVGHLREDCAEGVEPWDWAGHPMGDRFPYDSRGRLILEVRAGGHGVIGKSSCLHSIGVNRFASSIHALSHLSLPV